MMEFIDERYLDMYMFGKQAESRHPIAIAELVCFAVGLYAAKWDPGV